MQNMFQNIINLIQSDIKHHLFGTFYSNPVEITTLRLARALLTPEVQILIRYRIAHGLNCNGYTNLAWVIYTLNKHRGCDISYEASIGSGLRIVHPSDIVIGPDVVIGKNVVIFNGVTIGNKNVDLDNSMPIIGDEVMLGTGAKLLGAISIGNGATIGANSVVVTSISENQTAVGVPSRIIKNKL